MRARRWFVWSAVVAFLMLTVFLPAAQADHVYSHRYIVFGRVLDADHNPVPGLTVDVGHDSDFEAEGPCGFQPDTETDAYGATRTAPVTNQYGEFMVCYHTHGMSRALPGKGFVRIEEVGYESEFAFDANHRTTMLTVQLDSVHENANTEILDQEYTVQARFWTPTGQENLDGVVVWGIAPQQTNVTVTVAFTGQDPITVEQKTNNYGDIAFRVPVEGRPTGGTITYEISGEKFTRAVDPEVGWTTAVFEPEGAADPFLRNALTVGAVLAGVALIGGGGYWGIRKMSESRELAAAKASGTRKRANK